MQRDEGPLIENRIIDLISQHPEFLKLKGNILRKFPIHNIWGINEGLEEFLLRALEKEFQHAFIFSTEPDSDEKKAKYFFFHKKDKTIGLREILSHLEELGYKRVERVFSIGEFSLKGGILDIYIGEYILRLDYFGNDLENVLLIDPLTASVEYNINNIFIPYALNGLDVSEYDLPIFPDTVILFNNKERENEEIYHFDLEPIPFVFSNTKLLEYELSKRRGGIVVISSQNEEYIDKIKSFNIPFEIEYFKEPFNTGFSSKSLNISLFTDKELSGRLNLNLQKKKKAENLLLISEINLGDLIVHEDHGVGIYKGVVKKDVQGIIREYILLEYAKQDKLYIPLDQLAKLTKYIGAHGERPQLTRLGTMEWERAKEKVRKSIQEIAGELLKLYALREISQKSPIYVNEGYSARLENSFDYDLTPDQETTVEEVLKDLESTKPMDRLVVGDVGFGKTEIAIRAAFRVVTSGMQQVAVLSPTTILSQQLYDVFKHRLAGFPIRIESMSRFKGKESNRMVVKDLKEGKIDIVIGTHRLIQSDVGFKNLGLIIIDEEQRFGVKQKEKLKGLRIDTNVISMSATPIPRTLHMALSGAKDISVINTPPKGRLPIKTHIMERDWDRIKEIILYEKENGRQVYFVHNRVATIMNIKSKLEELMPNVRFIVGHGQMLSNRLEGVINSFRDYEYDVLIASTIIENGIDIPNVNTIIINQAQRFGLSQLYQLRGRVGRSDVQSYCYLLYPSDYELEGAARQRLYAIMNAQDLGSGFTIAVKDLEIRGAGNFLGREQHGNVSAVGFELFTRLLSTEVARLKELL